VALPNGTTFHCAVASDRTVARQDDIRSSSRQCLSSPREAFHHRSRFVERLGGRSYIHATDCASGETLVVKVMRDRGYSDQQIQLKMNEKFMVLVHQKGDAMKALQFSLKAEDPLSANPPHRK